MNYIFDLDDTLIENSDISYETLRDTISNAFVNKEARKNPLQQYKEVHYQKTKSYVDENVIGLVDQSREFLGDIEGYVAGLTNAPEKSTEYKTERLGLDQLLDTVITPQQAPKKPDPQGLEKIIEQSGHEKKSFVFVGDSVKDILTGKRANVKTVLITDEMKKYLAEESYPTFEEFAKQY